MLIQRTQKAAPLISGVAWTLRAYHQADSPDAAIMVPK
jgi:hypothetical protein